MAGSISSHLIYDFYLICNMYLCKTYSISLVVLITDLVFLSSTYQHPEIVVNIMQVHLPQQTLEFSHQDSSKLPSEHTHLY